MVVAATVASPCVTRRRFAGSLHIMKSMEMDTKTHHEFLGIHKS